MDNITKAIINIREGIIQLEGSEEFVRHYLEQFSKEVKFDSGNDKKKLEGIATKEENPDTESGKKNPKRKQIIKDVKVEKFDIDAAGSTPALKDFLSERNPGTVAKNRIAVIAYYVAKLKEAGSFNEGNIDYAYKALSLNKRPIYLRQILINLKNEKMWFEEGDESGSWKVTRVCEKFVEEELPFANPKNKE